MQPVNTENISAELPPVYVAIGILVLLILGLIIYTIMKRRPPPRYVQAFAILFCSGIIVVLVSVASAFFPGKIAVNASQWGPFSVTAQGQEAIFVLAVPSVFGAAGALVTYVLMRTPIPTQPAPLPVEHPVIDVVARTRPDDNSHAHIDEQTKSPRG